MRNMAKKLLLAFLLLFVSTGYLQAEEPANHEDDSGISQSDGSEDGDIAAEEEDDSDSMDEEDTDEAADEGEAANAE